MTRGNAALSEDLRLQDIPGYPFKTDTQKIHASEIVNNLVNIARIIREWAYKQSEHPEDKNRSIFKRKNKLINGLRNNGFFNFFSRNKVRPVDLIQYIFENEIDFLNLLQPLVEWLINNGPSINNLLSGSNDINIERLRKNIFAEQRLFERLYELNEDFKKLKKLLIEQLKALFPENILDAVINNCITNTEYRKKVLYSLRDLKFYDEKIYNIIEVIEKEINYINRNISEKFISFDFDFFFFMEKNKAIFESVRADKLKQELEQLEHHESRREFLGKLGIGIAIAAGITAAGLNTRINSSPPPQTQNSTPTPINTQNPPQPIQQPPQPVPIQEQKPPAQAEPAAKKEPEKPNPKSSTGREIFFDLNTPKRFLPEYVVQLQAFKHYPEEKELNEALEKYKTKLGIELRIIPEGDGIKIITYDFGTLDKAIRYAEYVKSDKKTDAWAKKYYSKEKIDEMVAFIAGKNQIDPYIWKALTIGESLQYTYTVSGAGAIGAAGLMPSTALERLFRRGVINSSLYYENNKRKKFELRKEYENRVLLSLVQNGFNLTDFWVNNVISCDYLAELFYDLYNRNMIFALAAYNSGPGAVKKANGVPKNSETQKYVEKIPRHADTLKSWERQKSEPFKYEGRNLQGYHVFSRIVEPGEYPQIIIDDIFNKIQPNGYIIRERDIKKVVVDKKDNGKFVGKKVMPGEKVYVIVR